jgi:inosose dehydratase
VTLALETHPDLITNAEVALETMRGVNHPNVRVNFDTANISYHNQGVDGVAELTKLLDHVGAVHLKETNGGYRTWFFPAFSERIVNFQETFRRLNARGFHGPFTLEIEGVEGENLTLEQTQARVAKSVGRLRRLGCVRG